MQFDQTQISIRERGPLETLDLALHVTRRYAWPLLVTMACGVVPLMLLNYLLIGWMGRVEYGQFMTGEDMWSVFRYAYDMSVLVFLEVQLASVFATRFIGQAVFWERPKLRDVVSSVLKTTPALFVWQAVTRGPFFAWLLLAFMDHRTEFTFREGLALPLVVAWSAFIRAIHPFMSEIIALEGNPSFSKNPQVVTIWRRTGMLHSSMSGDLMIRWIGAAVVGCLLSCAVFGTFLFMSGVFLNDWLVGPILMHLAFPISLWLVASYMTVYRFLSYLDTRIRTEGWEVELRMRAEANRLRGPQLGDAA